MNSIDNLLQKHSRIALCYLLIIAFFGVILRLFYVTHISFNYRYIVHAHSHIALLGWIYIALTTLIFRMYLIKSSIELKYKKLFLFTQITILGMLLTFPFTGYALFSIIFSTLFLFASYLFMYMVFKYTSIKNKQSISYRFVRISLWYMVISSIGPWALGIIMNTVGNSSSWYRNAIYFYLHFQYNGWFIMALIGVFIYILEQQKIQLSKQKIQLFFWLMNFGVLLTFGLSLLWMKPLVVVNFISGLGGFFQLIALIILVQLIRPNWKNIINKQSQLFYFGIRLVTLLYFVKLIVQLVGSIPYFSKIISTNIDLVIGYIHWVFLGVVSTSLLLFLNYFKLTLLTKKSFLFFLIGFILTEILIFYKAFIIWKTKPLIDNYFLYLVIASCVLFIAILNILILQFKKETKYEKLSID